MFRPVLVRAIILTGFTGACAGQANEVARVAIPSKESTMLHARGDFDVKLTPHPGPEGGAELGRQSIHKTFHGDLDGTCLGEMLAAMTAVEGSGAYVALDRFTGTLGGRKGSFLLMHYATMVRGVPHLSVTVVPDSGTEALTGLTGTLAIHIDAKGAHSYTFDYHLAP